MKYQTPVVRDGSNDLLVALSDIHYGIEFYSHVGVYNPDIARERIAKYAHEIIAIKNRHGSRNCHIALLGDLISGNNHKTIALENRENVVHQVIGCAELVADFIMMLQPHFEKICVAGVSGNHSRIEPKFNDA